MNFFKIAGIAAGLAVIAGLIVNWPDIMRYAKIERM
jgi:cytosine/uracil/thiamine/allantoin permease